MRTRRIQKQFAPNRGFTRLEILIAAGILGVVLAAGGWALGAQSTDVAKQAARDTAEKLLQAASDWKREHDISGCPSVSQLLLDKRIDKLTASDDPWGSRFRIVCRKDEVSVMSAGVDKQFRTEDDISLAADWRS